MKRVDLAATLAVLTLLLPRCGLGTEIGNGIKDDGDEEKRASASEESPKKDANKAEPQGSSPEGATDGAGDSDTATSGANGGPGTVDEAEVPFDPPFDFDLNALVAGCASPFAEDLESPFTLLHLRDDGTPRNKLQATLDASTGKWSLKDKDAALVRTVEKDTAKGALGVAAHDETGKPVGDLFTCAPVIVNANATADGLTGTFTRKSVMLSAGDLQLELAWYLKPGAGAKLTLARIEVDDADGEDDPVVLDRE